MVRLLKDFFCCTLCYEEISKNQYENGIGLCDECDEVCDL